MLRLLGFDGSLAHLTNTQLPQATDLRVKIIRKLFEKSCQPHRKPLF